MKKKLKTHTSHITALFLLLTWQPLPGLEPSADPTIELDPYVVTGTRTLQRLSESPVRTELLGGEVLQKNAANNLADSIELLPGLRVENNCQNCGTSEILLLGLAGQYSTVLFDGMPIYSGLASVYGLEQIPTLFIDRIEVVKGAGSAMYGSGAIGGVINIISRDPFQSGGQVELRFDSVKGNPAFQASGIIDHVSPDGRSVFSLYALAAENDPVDLNNDGLSELTKREMQVTGLQWRQNFTRGRLRVDYSYTDEFRRGGDRFELPDNLANISERIDTATHRSSVVWSSRISPDLDYSVSAGVALTDRATYYGGLFGNPADGELETESEPGAGDNDQSFIDRGYRTYGQVAQDQFGFTDNKVYHAEAQFNYRWSKHLTSWGLQLNRETIEDVVPLSPFVTEYPAVVERSSGDSIGVFVQDDWKLSDQWQLLLGLRADKNSELSQAILSPRLSLRYQPVGEWVLRGTIGTGFRAPQPFDEDLHIEIIAGDRAKTRQADDLEQENSFSGLLSAEWTPAFANGSAAIELTSFYTRITGTFTHSEIREDPISGEAFRERFNGPDAEVGGVELNIAWTPLPQLRLDIGYVAQIARYLETLVIFDDNEGNIINERDFLKRPNHYAILSASLLSSAFADLTVSTIFTGSMKDLNQRTGELNAGTSSFLVINVTLSRTFRFDQFPELTVTAGVKNLSDDRQSDIETGFDRDPYYFHGPRTPRTFFVAGRISF